MERSEGPVLVPPNAETLPFAELPDEALVTRIRAGEPGLFELLMRRHNRRIFRVARAIVRDADEAEDVMQEAYVRAFEHLEQFEGRARFATWLTRIAVHEASARRRRGERVRSLEALGQDGVMARTGPDDPGDGAANRELAVVLERAVDALPARARAVFVLREVEGLSTAETAESLEITEESVKVGLHRAKKLLRKELERKLGAAATGVYDFHLSRCDRVVARVLARLRYD